MKRKFLLATSFIMCFSFMFQTTIAQYNLKKGSRGIFLKPMLNAANIAYKSVGSSDATTSKTRIGYGIGADIYYALSNRFFVTVGAELNSRGHKQTDTRALYFDVPVTLNHLSGRLGFMGDDRVLIGLGAYAGLGIMGKYKGSNGWTKLNFGESTTDNRSRIDNGIIFNLGYQMDEELPLLIISFCGGLNNVIPNDRQMGLGALRLNTTKVYLYISLK